MGKKIKIGKPERKMTGNRIKKGNHSLNPGKIMMLFRKNNMRLNRV
jgi:hypothetical protein